MADFHASALQLYQDDAPAWLADLKAGGRDIWAKSAMPDRRTEAWKYTSIRALTRGEFKLAATPPAATAGAALAEHYRIAGLDAATIVFVNGHYSAALSTAAMPDGVELVRFADADPAQALDIRQYLGKVADPGHHLFAALNDSWATDGIFVRVRKQVEVPLQVVWLSLPQASPFAVSQRLLVVMEAGSRATLLEHFASDGERQNAFTNGTTELVIGPDASLRHYRLHLEEAHALHIGGVHADLARGASLDSFHLAFGAALKRIDVVVNHCGEGAECNLNGVYLPRHDEHVDYHTNIQHRAPRCTTSEIFRGIVSGRARAVFNGRIHIHPDAQKTRAELSNKNLLTSDKAEVDTKPELEIYADDVQCAHGATVAQLDEQAVFYLMSRGIARQDAQVMLSFGFINELVDKLADAAVAGYLRPTMAALFAPAGALRRQPT